MSGSSMRMYFMNPSKRGSTHSLPGPRRQGALKGVHGDGRGYEMCSSARGFSQVLFSRFPLFRRCRAFILPLSGLLI